MISSDINQEMEEVVEGRRDRYRKATNFCHEVPLNATCGYLTPTSGSTRRSCVGLQQKHISHLFFRHFSHQSMESMSPIRRVSENQAAHQHQPAPRPMWPSAHLTSLLESTSFIFQVKQRLFQNRSLLWQRPLTAAHNLESGAGN